MSNEANPTILPPSSSVAPKSLLELGRMVLSADLQVVLDATPDKETLEALLLIHIASNSNDIVRDISNH